MPASNRFGTKNRGQWTYLSVVIKNDPEWVKDKRKEVEYEFSKGRVFTGNPASRGAYEDG